MLVTEEEAKKPMSHEELQEELRHIYRQAVEIIRMASEMSSGHTSKLNAIAARAEIIQSRALLAMTEARGLSGNQTPGG